jgi:hypothetical protein
VLGFYSLDVDGTIEPGEVGFVSAYCDEGDYATGGGFSTNFTFFEYWKSHASQLNPPLYWTAGGRNITNFPVAISVSVVCADVTS